MTKKKIKIEDNYYYGMGLDIRKKNNQNMIEHSGVTLSFVSMLYIYPDLDLGIFVVTNTNDILCIGPTFDLFNNIEKFLVLDYYEGISDFFMYILLMIY